MTMTAHGRTSWKPISRTSWPCATRRDAQARFAQKLQLTRRLYECGLPRQTIIDLYRFLDWLMRLPEDLELQ